MEEPKQGGEGQTAEIYKIVTRHQDYTFCLHVRACQREERERELLHMPQKGGREDQLRCNFGILGARERYFTFCSLLSSIVCFAFYSNTHAKSPENNNINLPVNTKFQPRANCTSQQNLIKYFSPKISERCLFTAINNSILLLVIARNTYIVIG